MPGAVGGATSAPIFTVAALRPLPSIVSVASGATCVGLNESIFGASLKSPAL